MKSYIVRFVRMTFKMFVLVGVVVFVSGYFLVMFLKTLSQNTLNLLFMFVVMLVLYGLMLFFIRKEWRLIK